MPREKIKYAAITLIACFICATLVLVFHLRREEIPGAPRIWQSGPTGQATPMVDEGVTAVYDWYLNGSKIGYMSYRGVSARRIDIETSHEMMGYEFKGKGYAIMDPSLRLTRVFIEITGDGVTSITEITIDYALNKMEMEVTVDDIPSTAVEITFEPGALEPIEVGDLYVGWSRDCTFELDGIPQTMTTTITRRESITVPKGTFPNCFVAESSAPKEFASIWWITPDGGCPQFSMKMMGIDITCKLKSYYR